MSIIHPNDINPSVDSQDSSIIFLKNIIDKLDNIPHPMSRNERRGSFLANNNQCSTKEGTSNKKVFSKTIESVNENSFSSISNPKYSNKTHVQCIVSFDKKNDNFVYNNMLRANSIKRKISNEMKHSIERIKKKDKTVDNNNIDKKNNKEKIACCFFFK